MTGPGRRLLAPLALLVGLAPALLLSPPAALASCAMPDPLGAVLTRAEIVFVGSVTRTAQMGRWATVTVEEIWKGPDLPQTVLVKGGQGGNTMTSVDRTFEAGTRYLFLPSGSNPGLTDNACSSTTVWSADLEAMRPATIRKPGVDQTVDRGSDAPWLAPALVALVAVGILLGIGLLARGRQQGSPGG